MVLHIMLQGVALLEDVDAETLGVLFGGAGDRKVERVVVTPRVGVFIGTAVEVVGRQTTSLREFRETDHPGSLFDIGPPKTVGDDARRHLHFWESGQLTVFKLLFLFKADHVWSTFFELETATDLEMARWVGRMRGWVKRMMSKRVGYR